MTSGGVETSVLFNRYNYASDKVMDIILYSLHCGHNYMFILMFFTMHIIRHLFQLIRYYMYECNQVLTIQLEQEVINCSRNWKSASKTIKRNKNIEYKKSYVK